jgi:hypothetical protein
MAAAKVTFERRSEAMRNQFVIAAAGVILSSLSACAATVQGPVVGVTAPPVALGYQGVVKPVAVKRQVFHSPNPALCVDVQGDNAAQHANVRLSHCHGRENQRWDFGPGTNGAVQVGGIGGLCLSVMSAPAQGGSMTELLSCNGTLAEELRFYADGRIQELAGNKCLTASGVANDAPIILTTCDPTNPMQVWSLGNN